MIVGKQRYGALPPLTGMGCRSIMYPSLCVRGRYIIIYLIYKISNNLSVLKQTTKYTSHAMWQNKLLNFCILKILKKTYSREHINASQTTMKSHWKPHVQLTRYTLHKSDMQLSKDSLTYSTCKERAYFAPATLTTITNKSFISRQLIEPLSIATKLIVVFETKSL